MIHFQSSFRFLSSTRLISPYPDRCDDGVVFRQHLQRKILDLKPAASDFEVSFFSHSQVYLGVDFRSQPIDFRHRCHRATVTTSLWWAGPKDRSEEHAVLTMLRVHSLHHMEVMTWLKRLALPLWIRGESFPMIAQLGPKRVQEEVIRDSKTRLRLITSPFFYLKMG